MPDYSWIRGLITLGSAPDVETFKSLGLNVVLPFKTSAAEHLLKAGVAVIGNGAGGAWIWDWEKEYQVIAYFMADEPEWRGISADDILFWIRRCRSQTSLPITCLFPASAVAAHWNEWGYDRVWPELDFIGIGCYFYFGGGLRTREFEWTKTAITRAHNMGKPVVLTGQAFQEAGYSLTRPDMEYIYNFAKERDCGINWYSWNVADASLGNRPQDAWYNDEIKRVYAEFIETFTEQTITCPTCGSTLKLTISSVESHNLPMICPVCGENAGIGYTIAVISEEPWPVYTTQAKTCPQCSSELELTVSSLPEENTAKACPVCGVSIGEGTEVAVISEEPWPPIAEVVPWYKKYAPHLTTVGIIGTGIAIGAAFAKVTKKK